MTNGTIVIVEHDIVHCKLLVQIFQENGVKNQFRCFYHADPAIAYLRNTSEIPFIIISNIALPGMDGLAFKRVINQDINLVRKKIPFIFLSTTAATGLTEQVFNLSVQGFFQWPDDVDELRSIMKVIVEYWQHSNYSLAGTSTEKVKNELEYTLTKPASVRPLTSAMMRLLKEAFNRENLELSPLGINKSQQCKGLVTRGMMSFDRYEMNKKSFMGFHLTKEGRDFIARELNQYHVKDAEVVWENSDLVPNSSPQKQREWISDNSSESGNQN